MAAMNRRLRRTVLAAPIAVLAFSAAPATGQAATHSEHAKTKNANFKGHWHMSNAQDFIVKQESTKSGTCKGRTTLGTGYKFTDCKVTGHHFRFHITYTGGYVSYNAGTFTKHSLNGHWHDRNGAAGTYSATRGKVK